MIEDIKAIIPYAFRYALGRSTYASKEMVDIIIKHIEHIDTFMLEQFVRDIDRAIETGKTGYDCDVAQWTYLSGFITGTLSQRAEVVTDEHKLSL